MYAYLIITHSCYKYLISLCIILSHTMEAFYLYFIYLIYIYCLNRVYEENVVGFYKVYMYVYKLVD